jgi:hypothetical protein
VIVGAECGCLGTGELESWRAGERFAEAHVEIVHMVSRISNGNGFSTIKGFASLFYWDTSVRSNADFLWLVVSRLVVGSVVYLVTTRTTSIACPDLVINVRDPPSSTNHLVLFRILYRRK